MTIAPSTSISLRRTAGADDHLAAFLRDLVAAETAGDTLRVTLQHALAASRAQAGVALASNGAVVALPDGSDDTGLAALGRRVWQAGGDAALPDGVRCWRLGAGERPGLLLLRRPAAGATSALDAMAAAAGRLLRDQEQLRQAGARLAELGLLNEVATAMSATLELPALLESIIQRTRTALRSEACTLMLLDEATGELVFEIPVGAAGGVLRRLRVPVAQGVCGWVVRHGSPAIVNETRSDPRFDAHVDESSGFVTRNLMAVPLLARGRVTGVVEVLNTLDGQDYAAGDLALLTTLAGQAAVALDNAQLYSSLQTEHERLLAAEEQVRKELARDLHDGPAQRLAAICMQVEVLRKLIAVDPDRLPAELDSLDALARKANREVRTLQFQLRPVMLETRGLRAAVEYYVNQLRETEPITLVVRASGCRDRLPAAIEQAAFGVVQEALGNIRKHAGARQATVRLTERRGHWVIAISDDGKGFDVAATLGSYETRGSLGLLNMRERGQAMGGSLEIRSAPGQGTTVTLVIPSAGAPPAE
jgi:signal transduction histidine kinase